LITDTNSQYDSIIADCRNLFIKKHKDYGAAWRILRPSSLTDQIFIKAQRIRTIEEKGTKLVNESTEAEFTGIVNYGIMALIQLELGSNTETEMPQRKLLALYDAKAEEAKALMMRKNHDYGEAWRDMRVSSFTDLILMKILRLKQIENNKGQTIVSEGAAANYMDIINYAVFALITLKFGHEESS